MLLIEWKQEFETGLEEADREHAQLFDRINAIYYKLNWAEGEGAVREVLIAVYTEIAMHFMFEEKAMQQHGYDQFADHKAEHDQLLGEFRDIIASLDASATYDYERTLMARLVAWFARHFKAKDTRLHQTIGRAGGRHSH